MTHEELLALLDEYGHWDDWGFYPPLRAVVEFISQKYSMTVIKMLRFAKNVMTIT